MKTHKSAGFTLIELLVAAAIIACLAGILLPPLNRVAQKVEEKRTKDEAAQKERIETSIITNTASALTVGNNSYITVGLPGTPEENSMVILKALAEFEKNNLGKEIIGWSVEKQQEAHSTEAKVFGLWVQHKPKTVALEQPTP